MFIYNSILNRTNLIRSPIKFQLIRQFNQFKSTNESIKLKKLTNLNSSHHQLRTKSNDINKKNNNLINLRNHNEQVRKSKDFALYGFTVVLIALALTYASVPIYRIYCQATGKGGKPKVADDFLANKVKKMKKNKEKLIIVSFVADKQARMRWNFKPTQDEVKVYPGETALAFFTAKNPTTLPVNGVSTYSVAPVEAGQYLNKIQCFCFEEQRLDPGEEIDMPVFFYFDPEFAEDPRLENVNQVTLAYTFFESSENQSKFKLPEFPSFSKSAVV